MSKTPVLKINPREPESDLIQKAARLVRRGGLVAFPTETVYGLAANLLDKNAVERLYSVKKRPEDKPLTVHIAGMDILHQMVGVIPPSAERLIKSFWPGPLTIVLLSKDGKKTGFRMPSNKIALSLIEASGVPVAAPSANISGKRPPRTAAEVLEDLDNRIDMILDGGPAEVGLESTVVDATVFPCKVLREKAIAASEIIEAAG